MTESISLQEAKLSPGRVRRVRVTPSRDLMIGENPLPWIPLDDDVSRWAEESGCKQQAGKKIQHNALPYPGICT
jgi:hypothetical protein